MTTMEFETEDCLDFADADITSDSSFPATFAGYFSTEIGKDLQSYFNDIATIWLNIGIPVNNRDEKINELRDTIFNQVKKFQEDEQNQLNKQLNYREYQLGEINKILKALSLEAYTVDSSKTLLSQNKILHLKYKELLHVKTERMEHLERITCKLKKVFHLLGMQYEDPIFATNIPSESELMNVRSVLLTHEQTLETKKKRFENLKGLMLKYQKDLEYTPQNSKETMIMSSSEIIFSQEIMTAIADFHKKITDLYKDAKTELEDLKKHLFQLFDRLDVDSETRKLFLQSLNGTFVYNKQLLKIEIEKYEVLKKSSMKKIIMTIRKDIDQLLKTCMISTFNDYILESEDFTEDLLILHETEYDKLCKFNQFYSCVFEKLRDWEDSLEKLSELEKKLLDPNRFNNRGGALLQNERERRLLMKKLPKVEKEIRSLVTMIQEKENVPFNSYGLEIDEYFKFNWDQFKETKDIAKLVVSKKTGDSSKKSAPSSSQKKSRYPLSPRMNNLQKSGVSNNLASRRLFTASNDSGKAKFELDELEFQKHIAHNRDILHSTVLENDVFSAQSKLIRTPTSVNLRSKMPNRRLSKSYDDLTKLGNRGPLGVTKRLKKPPFLP